MKRARIIWTAALLAAALTWAAFASASSLDALMNPISVFEPKKMTEAYNDSIGTFFDVLAEGTDHTEIEKEFRLSLTSASDGEVVYTNRSGDIVLTFYAPDENTKADKLVFWCSGTSEYRNIPELVFGWAVAFRHVDGATGIELLEWLNGSTDGDTYQNGPYRAEYSMEKDVFSSFTLYPND